MHLFRPSTLRYISISTLLLCLANGIYADPTATPDVSSSTSVVSVETTTTESSATVTKPAEAVAPAPTEVPAAPPSPAPAEPMPTINQSSNEYHSAPMPPPAEPATITSVNSYNGSSAAAPISPSPSINQYDSAPINPGTGNHSVNRYDGDASQAAVPMSPGNHSDNRYDGGAAPTMPAPIPVSPRNDSVNRYDGGSSAAPAPIPVSPRNDSVNRYDGGSSAAPAPAPIPVAPNNHSVNRYDGGYQVHTPPSNRLNSGYRSQPTQNYYPNNKRYHHEKQHNQFSINVTLPSEPTYIAGPMGSRPIQQWIRSATGMGLPRGIVVGGYQRAPRATLHVCRGLYRGGVHPGKLYRGVCYVSWGGSSVALNEFEVLTSRIGLQWKAGSRGYIPRGAIQGGYQQDAPLYICQASYQGNLIPGKMYNRVCNFAWHGREVFVSHYDILTR